MFPTIFASAFITTTFLLQWWILPSYPITLWLLLGFLGIAGFLPFGKLPFRARAFRAKGRAFGGCVRYQRTSTSLLLCIIGISLALWNVARTEQSIVTSLEHLPLGTRLQIEGMVTGLPEFKQESVTYTIALRTIEKEQERLPVKGKITVRTKDSQARFLHGETVHINGNIERIPSPYEKYFRAQGIIGSVSYAKMVGTGRREGSFLLNLLTRWNTNIATRIRDIFPEPEASLLAGLLLGDTGGFSRETLAAFRTAGLTHILAVSGYNITLLLIAISVLVARLPHLIRFGTALVTVALFTLLVGGSPSAIRAAVMGILGLLALHTKHLPETRRTMLLTAFLMLLWNPMQLWWNASFQLSFLAVIGITELQPFLKKLLKHLPETMGIRETLTVTLAAQCTALPWAAALFGNLPLLSPVANILVAPAIPFIMLTGPIALLGGTLHDSLGRLLAFPCWVALQWIIRVAETIVLFPLASIPFPQKTLFPIILYYAALALIVRNKNRQYDTLPTTDTGRSSPPPAKGEPCAPR